MPASVFSCLIHVHFSFVRIAFYLAIYLPHEYFAKSFLLHLLTLQSDPVDNVRLAVARLLSQIVHPGEFASL